MKIGYQGMVGSNAYMAAMELAKSQHIENAEYLGLISSINVITELERGNIDYGVVATKNSIGGEVIESMNALRNRHLELVATHILPIHHSLFKKSAEIANDSLRRVASHIQALKQTSQYIKRNFPAIEEVIEVEDTALSAEKLADGELGEDTVVICSRLAGENAGLSLIANNIEDQKDNRTEFRLLKRPDPKYMEHEAMQDNVISGSSLKDKFIRAGLILLIISSFAVVQMFDLTPYETACTLSGYAIMLYLIFVRLHRRLINKTFVGYWKYYTVPSEENDEGAIQHYHVPRIVEIREVDGKLEVFGYTSNLALKDHISFRSEYVHINDMDSKHGLFTYKYRSTAKGINLGGYVILKWYKKNGYSMVKKMEGEYFGVMSREMGTLEYQRISMEEFNNIKICEFLQNT
ncbi:MAG: hypothetical protein IJY45_00280 [Tidjanibacter sp.]|nr:hypothetical protein [Tidjanibacter sp.]